MTEKELRAKIISKAAEMIDNVQDVEELYKISQIYCDVTKEDWAQKVFQSLSDMQDNAKYDYALLKPEDKQLLEQDGKSMTNIERIRKMDAEDLIKTMDSILHCKFRKYVDLPAFMNGESESLSDYLKVKYYGLFQPCEAEIQAYKNEAKQACENFDFDERKYIEDHSRLFPVVDEYSLQGYNFCVVIDNNQIADIDSSNLRIKYGKEKPNLNKADTENESGLRFNISVKNGVVMSVEPDRKDDIS